MATKKQDTAPTNNTPEIVDAAKKAEERRARRQAEDKQADDEFITAYQALCRVHGRELAPQVAVAGNRLVRSELVVVRLDP